MTAIQVYLDGLVLEGALDSSYDNRVYIDKNQQMEYLKSVGVDIDTLSEQELKECNTKDKVFLASNIKILDAIEDVVLNVTI